MPFAPKDLFDTAGMRTTYGSALFRDHVPTRTATAVQRIVDAGAVIVGKANLHEFAWGVTSKNPFYGTVGNPRRPGHIAGGSSGGSAAALSAGLAALSIGTDTGGSIRIPSFACGTSGFKPSHGLVPIDGCFPLVPAFDHAGPMARTMEECALALEVLADLPRPEPRLAGLRVGVLGAVADTARLEGSGAHCEEAALPPWEHALPIFSAECAYTHRELYAARREEYSADLQRKMEPGFELTAVTYRALWDEVEAWRARCARELALRHPRLPDAAVRAAARRGGRERGVPGARDRVGATVQLARLAVGDDARRHDDLGAQRRDRARGRARVGGRPASRYDLLNHYCSGFVPAIQMITRVNFPSSLKVKKLQLCMSFLEPSLSSPK